MGSSFVHLDFLALCSGSDKSEQALKNFISPLKVNHLRHSRLLSNYHFQILSMHLSSSLIACTSLAMCHNHWNIFFL